MHFGPNYPGSAAFINLKALAGNYGLARELAGGTPPIAVVKANAYGHGADIVAPALARAGCRSFAVANVDEALALRKAGIDGEIILLYGFTDYDLDWIFEFGLSPVIYRKDQGEILQNRAAKRNVNLGVHLDIDTGMGRVGVRPDEAEEFYAFVSNLPNIKICGAMTHYSEADLRDSEFTGGQVDAFRKAIGSFADSGFDKSCGHIANSAALLKQSSAPESLARPGLMLYGLDPFEDSPADRRLLPVLGWRARILHIKTVEPGATISYGRTFRAERTTKAATVAIGYADGYNRLLSNQGRMLVGGQSAPVIGRVCMDLTVIDITEIPDVNVGDEAIILGTSGDQKITAEELARQTDTINYEVITSIGSRVRRIAVDE